MNETITVPALSLDESEAVCAALRTWAPPLADFYRALIDSGAPPDLATALTNTWFQETLTAGYALPNIDDDY